MKRSFIWSLLCVALVEVVYTLKPSPYRSLNCTIGKTHYYEAVVNDMRNELAVNCMNASLNLTVIEECLRVRTIDLLYVDSCSLQASLPIAAIHNLKILSLKNSQTEDTFVISNLPIETLFIQKLTAKEIQFHNLLFLEHLTILNMDWKAIPGKPFQNLGRLRTLFLLSNQLEHLEEDTFHHLTKLLVLNLSGNKLQWLPENLFKNTRSLEYLLLNRNRFTSFNSTAFSSLKSLTRLTIAENMLQELPKDLLASVPQLEYIDLSSNFELTGLPRGFFNTSRKLGSFRMSHCTLNTLAADTFKSCPLLKIISLENNRLKNIVHNTFFSFSLAYLDLSNNSLLNLPPNLFGSNHRLEHLNLSKNHLSRIPSNALSDMFSLVTLNLSYNDVDAVDAKDFEYLSNLERLDLSNNKIKYVYSFGNAKSISFLDLSFNSIQLFPNISWKSYKIETIDLSNNDIKHFSTADLSFTLSTTIDLQHNKIASVQFGPTIESFLILYLGFNPFTCDCSLVDFVQYLQSENDQYPEMKVADVRNLRCSNPAEWKGTPLTDIISFRLCPVSSSCPIRCHCFQMQNQKVLVNCSASELTDFPSILPPNASIVHLEYNRIYDFPVSNSKRWTNVSHIYLDKNELTGAVSWTPPSSLKILSLCGNNITELPNSLLTFISNASSFVLDIRDNPWICSCSLLSFKRWFMRNLKKIAFPEEVLCQRLVNQTIVFQAIQDIPEDAFCEPGLRHDRTNQIIHGIVLSLVSLIIVTAIIVYYRWNETILAYIYVHVPLLYCCSLSRVDHNKPYDAFISYTASDRDTVLVLVDELEKNPPHFKLCIHERDWMAGYPITLQIEMSVANSKKTIIILSKDYLESFWCETEFQTAYLQSLEDRIDRIIIIVKGDLPERDTIPLDVQNLLTSKTYLVWGEKWFWEKLRYALPRYAPSITNKDIEKIEQVEGMISSIRNK